MMARASTSTADRLRAHRKLFVLAQELGCTPREAEAVLAVRRAEQEREAVRARWLQTSRRLQAKMDAPIARRPTDLADLPDERWMMRD